MSTIVNFSFALFHPVELHIIFIHKNLTQIVAIEKALKYRIAKYPYDVSMIFLIIACALLLSDRINALYSMKPSTILSHLFDSYHYKFSESF